jgi:hypothetical protein
VAEETITRLIDDIDGGEATQKVLLGLNGEWRGLDLNDKNHAALLKGLERFWDAARPVRSSAAAPSQPRRSRGGGRSTSDRGYDLGMLREWAAETGTAIPARGRIAGTTVTQFQAALEDGWKPKGD